MNKHIFISYTRSDSDFAYKLNSDLQFNKVKTWIDKKGIRSGEDWHKRIAKEISDCSALLVVLSPNAVKSKWVLRELSFADQKGKPIIPLIAHSCVLPLSVELLIGNIQRASFVQGDYERNFQKLYVAIAEILGLESEQDVKISSEAGVSSSDKSKLHPDGEKESSQLKIEPPAIRKPHNLSFTEPMLGNQPTGWFNSFMFVDNVSLEYSGKIVPRPDGAGGVCVLFQNPNATKDEFGSLMQRCPVGNFAGKVIRLEGEVKIENIENWAGLWLRADGHERSNLFFDNMSDRGLRGTIPWRTYKIDAPLPRESVWLNYGLVLVGKGKMWADNLRILLWENGQWKEISDTWQ